jgi:O-antigen ligase
MLEISPRATLPEKNIFVVLLLGLVSAELLIIIASLSFPLEVMAAIVGIGVLYFIFKNTFASLCTLVLLHYFVLRGTEQITLPEIFFGLYFCAFLGAWFFRKTFLERQPILIDRLDYALAAFLGFCVLSLIPAVLVGSSLFKWLRELIPYLSLLLVFPIREQTNNPKRVKILIACFLLLGFAIAIDNLFSYKQTVARALQFWQIAASRQTGNTVLFMAIVIVAGGFIVMAGSALGRWVSLFVFTVFAGALIITFARGFWVATLVGLMASFWLLPGDAKRRMVVYLGLSFVAIAGVAFLLFGDLATFIFDAVGKRFQTVGSATRDVSFANRLVEAQAVLAQIKANPIVGYGLGKAYFYEALIPGEMPTTYVHNTVLFVWYKVGLFGMLCLVVFIGGILLRCFRALKSEADAFIKILLIGLIACLVSMIVITPSSPQFIDKDSMLVGALIGGLAQSIWRRQQNHK